MPREFKSHHLDLDEGDETQDYGHNIEEMLRQLLRVHFVNGLDKGMSLQQTLQNTYDIANEIAQDLYNERQKK